MIISGSQIVLCFLFPGFKFVSLILSLRTKQIFILVSKVGTIGAVGAADLAYNLRTPEQKYDFGAVI